MNNKNGLEDSLMNSAISPEVRRLLPVLRAEPLGEIEPALDAATVKQWD
jgi:hypothetical protein